MTWGISLRQLPDYFLGGVDLDAPFFGGKGTWQWVRAENPEMQRFDSREAAEHALTLLPIKIRKDAEICEVHEIGFDSKEKL